MNISEQTATKTTVVAIIANETCLALRMPQLKDFHLVRFFLQYFQALQ